MIGTILHLLACALDDAREAATRTAMALLCRLPCGGEVDRLAAECDVLRGERDEARLEHAAAVEVCDDLRGLLTTARQERDALRAAAASAVAAGQLYEEGTVSRADARAAGLALARLCLPASEAPRG